MCLNPSSWQNYPNWPYVLPPECCETNYYENATTTTTTEERNTHGSFGPNSVVGSIIYVVSLWFLSSSSPKRPFQNQTEDPDHMQHILMMIMMSGRL